MIKQKEIIQIARKNNVPKNTIDKDWILGHYLNALFSFESLCNVLIFKGGTCIKKCFVENYRFSEDLDFTLKDEKFDINEKLIKKINKVANDISGAKFQLDYLNNTQSEDIDQGYEIKIKFWGADHHPNQRPLPSPRWQTSIKLDISFSEKLKMKPKVKKIIHPYSDSNLITNNVYAYNLNEIIAEKIRSLVQRNRPRDIYDNWYFSRTISKNNYPIIKEILLNKAKDKNIKINNINQFVNNDKKRKNQKAWESSLNHQISDGELPEFEVAYNEVKNFLESLLKFK